MVRLAGLEPAWGFLPTRLIGVTRGPYQIACVYQFHHSRIIDMEIVLRPHKSAMAVLRPHDAKGLLSN